MQGKEPILDWNPMMRWMLWRRSKRRISRRISLVWTRFPGVFGVNLVNMLREIQEEVIPSVRLQRKPLQVWREIPLVGGVGSCLRIIPCQYPIVEPPASLPLHRQLRLSIWGRQAAPPGRR